jgi:hypothetical protein
MVCLMSIEITSGESVISICTPFWSGICSGSVHVDMCVSV